MYTLGAPCHRTGVEAEASDVYLKAWLEKLFFFGNLGELTLWGKVSAPVYISRGLVRVSVLLNCTRSTAEVGWQGEGELTLLKHMKTNINWELSWIRSRVKVHQGAGYHKDWEAYLTILLSKVQTPWGGRNDSRKHIQTSRSAGCILWP